MKHLLLVENLDRYFLTHRLALAQRLQARYRVSVACAVRDHGAAIRAAGFDLYPLPLQREGMNPWHEWRLLRALDKLYRHLQPDLVHHFNIKPVIYGTLAARRLGIPTISTVTGLGQGFDQQQRLRYRLITTLYRLALSNPEVVVTFQNSDDRQLFVALGLVRELQAHLVRGSGVDTERFEPLQEPETPPIVLFAARLMFAKGVGDFVTVARRLQGQGLRFVLVGDPDSDNRDSVSAAKLASWRDEGIVELWGYCDDMPAVLSRASMVVLPSRYREGIPKILIEAAACARPIVTYDRPGCREIVEDGVNGVLVKDGDIDALASEIAALGRDDARRAALGAAGRQRVLDRFSIEQVTASFDRLYQQTLGLLE